MRKLVRWVFGTQDEHPLRRRLRAVPVVLLLAPAILWIRDDEPPPVGDWIAYYAVALVALMLLNYRRRPREVEHRVEITEHHPPPGKDWEPYRTAACSCGWSLDGDQSARVTTHRARRHSNTGEPPVVRA